MKDDFAVFIMVHGRPDKMWTYKTLRKQGYTGKIFLVADNLDKTVNRYKEKYGDELLIFDKKKASLKMDAGDNTGDLRSTLFSANTIFDLAKENNIKYFFIMCDDYTRFEFKINLGYKLKTQSVKNLDKVINCMLDYYKKINCLTIAFAQGGDFIGGASSQIAKKHIKRKAMNTFLCSTDRPFKFLGRMNEDVTTYVNLGSKGKLFFTISDVSIIQNQHQAQDGGLTELYLDYGTYVKSFFSVMYNPSCVVIKDMGESNRRIHHKVKWNNAVPKILNEKYKVK
jgi:hypothetical protein